MTTFSQLLSVLLFVTVLRYSHGQTTGVPLTKLGDRFYYFEKTATKNWFSADKFCRSHGLVLVSLETRKEAELVSTWLYHNGLETGGKGMIWTSAIDWASHGNWYWSPTSQDLITTFVRFEKSEPVPATTATQHCLALKKWDLESDFRCHNIDCLTELRFMCERPDYCWGFEALS